MEPLSLAVAFGLGLLLGVIAGGLVVTPALLRRRTANDETLARLADQALRSNLDSVVGVARERLGEEREHLTRTVHPIQEGLRTLGEATAALGARLGGLEQAAGQLNERTATLATALAGTRSGGRWGELALHNVVTTAGLTEHCDFEEQPVQEDSSRPDLVVRLPGGGRIAVDAKAPLADYLTACHADSRTDQRAALDRYARSLAGHFRALAKRDYARSLGGQLDLVVMFLPSDAMWERRSGMRPGYSKTPSSRVFSSRRLRRSWRCCGRWRSTGNRSA
jgi:DNA recombination protein RmuC